MSTSDLYDANPDAEVCQLQLRDFGRVRSFSGRVRTVRCFEDNVLVKQTLTEPGDGCVLVIDAGGSFRCALVGDNVAGLACEHGWAGIVLNGCVRDVEALAELPVGLRALGACPRPSGKSGAGEVDVPVTFGNATFTPGTTLHADADGIVVVG